MNDKTIETIFGSADRVKIIRIFVFNPEKIFLVDFVGEKVFLTKARAQKETKNLERAGLLVPERPAVLLSTKVRSYLSPLQEFLPATNPTAKRKS